MEKIITTIFAPHCSVCGQFGVGLCRNCLAKCDICIEETCLVCDKSSLNGQTHVNCTCNTTPKTLFCAYIYKEVVRNVIRVSKYNQKEFYALKKLSATGAVFASKCGVTYSPNTIVVPIPLSKERMRERGFNQSEVIAKEVGKEFNLQVDTKLLVRQKATQAQAKLSRSERKQNLKDAFAIAPQKSIQNRTFVLVDDICTTGSTFLSAATTLLLEGATQVDCFALAKKVL